MSKKLSTHTRKFFRLDATCLSPEAIEEIRNAQNNIQMLNVLCVKTSYRGSDISKNH